MKTWFCKDTQKWVSELPRAFWLSIYDAKTKEKMYSDEPVYIKMCGKLRKISNGIRDCRKYYNTYNFTPFTYINQNYRYSKTP